MSGSGPFQDKPSLRVDGLAVTRGGRVLFDNLSFAVEASGYGELRGANGSGKTSLLRAIAGMLRPAAGGVAFHDGADASTALHYVGHLNALKGPESARAHVRYWADLFGAAAREDVLETVGLAKQAELPARALSQGQARRLALSRLLIAPRPIWLLDEPAAALDDRGRSMLRAMIDAHRARGGLALAAVHEPLGPDVTSSVVLS